MSLARKFLAHGCFTSTVDVITGIHIQRSNIPLSLWRIDSRKPEFHGLTINFLSSLTTNMQRRVRRFFITLISLWMSFKPLKMAGWLYLGITFMELSVNKSTLHFVPMLDHLRKDASSVRDGRVWRVSHQQTISNRSDRYNFPVQRMQTSISLLRDDATLCWSIWIALAPFGGSARAKNRADL